MMWPTDNYYPTRVKSSILNEAQNQSVMHHSGLFAFNWDSELVPGQIEFFFLPHYYIEGNNNKFVSTLMSKNVIGLFCY